MKFLFLRSLKTYTTLLFTGALLFTTGCEDDAHDDHEEGEDHHGMAIHVQGVSAGSTSFKLQLMHDGHADYTSTNNVPVTVN